MSDPYDPGDSDPRAVFELSPFAPVYQWILITETIGRKTREFTGKIRGLLDREREPARALSANIRVTAAELESVLCDWKYKDRDTWNILGYPDQTFEICAVLPDHKRALFRGYLARVNHRLNLTGRIISLLDETFSALLIRWGWSPDSRNGEPQPFVVDPDELATLETATTTIRSYLKELGYLQEEDIVEAPPSLGDDCPLYAGDESEVTETDQANHLKFRIDREREEELREWLPQSAPLPKRFRFTKLDGADGYFTPSTCGRWISEDYFLDEYSIGPEPREILYLTKSNRWILETRKQTNVITSVFKELSHEEVDLWFNYKCCDDDRERVPAIVCERMRQRDIDHQVPQVDSEPKQKWLPPDGDRTRVLGEVPARLASPSADRAVQGPASLEPPAGQRGLVRTADEPTDKRRSLPVSSEKAVGNTIRKSDVRKGGRPRDSDATKDSRIAEAWKSGKHPTYESLAREFGMRELEVKHAIDRDRKRKEKQRPPGKTQSRAGKTSPLETGQDT
jgi:hypothetical protein